jgi:serine/threonine protein kinase
MTNLVSGLKIGTKIGNGHFGEVFLGEDEVHGKVAVKVLTRASGEADSDWAKRKKGLLAEAQNLAMARHPNVVPVYHIVEADDGSSILFCMDFCEGGSLLPAFKNGPMTFSAVRNVTMEVLLGLQSLHHEPMLHRDIKPGNILLDGHGVAKLGDFGLVTDELILGYGSIAGYSDHIAIEVWRDLLTSAKSDIWALGMTIYRLLHGKTWYEESPRPAGVVQKGGFAASLKWLPHIPDQLRRIIRKMMHDDTSARFQSADQVLSAFSKLPVKPDWDCTVTPARVQWTRDTQSRRITVQWDRLAPQRHEWRAWSEPLGGKGRRANLGSSNGVVRKDQAVRELEAFFER